MTTNDPRKATDVILEIESKLEHLTDIMMAVDLSIRTISNKLNTLEQIVLQISTTKVAAVTAQAGTPAPRMVMPQGFPQIQANMDVRNVQILAEEALPQTNSPEGFRRTSRPETYIGVKPELPKNVPAEVIVPKPISKPGPATVKIQFPEKQPPPETKPSMAQNQIPVMQRCVDKTGKSIFLASVVVIDMSSGEEVAKTKTNPIGNWSTTLPVGTYQVSIKKEAGIGKDKIEAMQDLRVTSDQSKIELPMLIIK